eukprot:scaffold8780_cov130-Isochrysis_galbana.AAC.17
MGGERQRALTERTIVSVFQVEAVSGQRPEPAGETTVGRHWPRPRRLAVAARRRWVDAGGCARRHGQGRGGHGDRRGGGGSTVRTASQTALIEGFGAIGDCGMATASSSDRHTGAIPKRVRVLRMV